MRTKMLIYAGAVAMLALCVSGFGQKGTGNGLTIEASALTTEETVDQESLPVEGKSSNSMVPKWTVIQAEDGFTDLSVGTFVAAYNVLDYGADPTGQVDNTVLFQKLLDSIGSMGGGTLYVPNGMYKLEGRLKVPKGTTIRGDWKEPGETSAIEGTVLMAYAGRGETNYDLPFINMEVGAGVMNVAIWYPEQDPMDVQPYSPAITMGVPGYFGNEYNNVKNVTMVNAYTGVLFSYLNGGASPVIYGIYGTPLKAGVEIDNIADVGRIEHVNLSPSYWVNSGLYERLGIEDPFKNQKAETAVRDYIYNNATGVIMRRNDWSYTCYINVDGYQYGYRAMKTVKEDADSTPNGHHYGFNFKNCQTGVSIEASNGVGIMFSYLNLEQCERGITIAKGTSGAIQFQKTTIKATDHAVYMDAGSATKLQFSEGTIESGKVTIDGGTFDVVDTHFKNGKQIPHVSIGMGGRVNMVGNRYNGKIQVENKSLFTSNISMEDASMKKLPKYIEIKQETKLPASLNLFLVTDYGAVADGKTDCTPAVRAALDAASVSGGIVFFPPGHYRFDDTLTIPTGVEMRGAVDNSSVPHGEGTILEVYCGENNPEGDPFLKLKKGSGIRGLTINYPNQIYTGTKEVEPDYAPIPYPYTIQGQGKDIYIINIGLRASYMGVDLFTYPCDNHYVDYLTGHMFNVGINVAGSKDGIIKNMQCNTIIYACGSESKFGSFPNSPKGNVPNKPIYNYAYKNLDSMIIGDSKNELIYNDFNFGANKGIIFRNNGKGGPKNGLAIGLGLDADYKGIYMEEGLNGADFELINTQIVSVNADQETEYIYSESNNNYEITLYGADFWGNPTNSIRLGKNSGNFYLQNGRFLHPGKEVFALLEGGTFSMKASSVEKIDRTAELSGNAKLIVGSSLINSKGVDLGTCTWTDNISLESEMSSDNPAFSDINRSNWRVDASDNPENAGNSIDGNPDTRWDTAGSQKAGQWFMIDMKEAIEFDCLILELAGSPNDAPASYEVYVSMDGENWGTPVAVGQSGSGIIPFKQQSARFIKIIQTGTKGNYWSIHECYVLDTSKIK